MAVRAAAAEAMSANDPGDSSVAGRGPNTTFDTVNRRWKPRQCQIVPSTVVTVTSALNPLSEPLPPVNLGLRDSTTRSHVLAFDRVAGLKQP
jgi:hypothetical protein